MNTGLVKVTARLLDLPLSEVPVDLQNEKDLNKDKSQTGKFPVLETPEGQVIFEGISIAKYLAR